ncbi:hypothetical protein C0J52_19252 [Blattella germanica]|nr:hypothetical protein C0J52_19252 [Blattella germanica]
MLMMMSPTSRPDVSAGQPTVMAGPSSSRGLTSEQIIQFLDEPTDENVQICDSGSELESDDDIGDNIASDNEEILETHGKTLESPRQGRPSKLPTPDRLTARHFIERIPPTDKKAKPTKRCPVCCKKTGKRKETSFSNY